MLIKIAWKNIWRNRTRSAILITAISLGIWALIFINGVSIGMVEGYIDSAILERTSHLQIHLPEFVEEPEITRHFDREPVISYLDTSAFVKEYSSRIFANGMIVRRSPAVGLRSTESILPKRTP